MSVDKEFTRRINLLIERYCSGNISKFAESVNAKRSGMSKIARGDAMPSFATIQEILKVYPDTDAQWFIVGTKQSESPISKSVLSANEDKVEYGNNNLISIFREQLKEKDKQLDEKDRLFSELIQRIPK